MLGPDDSAILDNVAEDVFDFDVRADSVSAFLIDPNSLLAGALDGDTVVGMTSALLYVHPDKPRQMFINEVGVAGPWRRRGIGRALVARMLDEARSRGCTEAWIATETSNVAARALYAAAGGIEDEERAVVYTWRLSEEDSN